MTVDTAHLPTLKLGSTGPAVEAAKIGVNRWRRIHRLAPGNTTRLFGVFFRGWIKEFQKAHDVAASGVVGPVTWEDLLPYIPPADKQRLLPQKPLPPSWRDVGPVVAGDSSVLDHSLTHDTDGIDLYPAFDTAFGSGRRVIAPEPLEITRNPRTGAAYSGSNPGEAFYCTGKSRLRYWFGHLDRHYPPGTRFKKGAFLGYTIPTNKGGGPHCHVGVNVELLWGPGTELAHKTGYRTGAPTIRAQLAAHDL